MFIKVTNTSDEEVAVNTYHIVSVYKNQIGLASGISIDLTEESIKEVNENIFGEETNSNPKATQHTASLLNELNRLVGGRGDAKPTTDRKARLKSRLKDFSEEELKIAATNLGNDEFMQGANEQGKRYGTIDYLIRTSANINKWLEEQPQKKKGLF